MSDSIFASVRTESRFAPTVAPAAPREPAPCKPAPREPGPMSRQSSPVLVAQPATLHTRTTHACTNDAACISILDAPLRPGETARVGFLRKEAELRDAFAKLPVAAQRALHARLASPSAGDQLAERFARLTHDRRTRLLTFLSDARRREALATANHR